MVRQAQNQQGAKRKPRIPLALQAIFVASNSGQVVHKPPPGRVANRTFLRKIVFSLSSISVRRKKNKNNRTTVADTDSLTSRTSRAESIKPPKARAVPAPVIITSPQAFFEDTIRQRGYPTTTYITLQTAYRNKPTVLQKASYDSYIINTVKQGDARRLAGLLSCGLSPNPCNSHGESLLHLVCRLGKVDVLHVMLDAGSDIQVSDDYGRTPLHDACWGSSTEVAAILLERDPHLIVMRDSRGSLPLEYVPKPNHAEWLEFLKQNMETFWPSVSLMAPQLPVLALQQSDSRPVPDPRVALPIELARLVSSGRIMPEEAAMLMSDDCEDDDDDDDDGSDEEDSESYSSEGDSQGSSDLSGSDYSYDEDDFTLRGVVLRVPSKPVAVSPPRNPPPAAVPSSHRSSSESSSSSTSHSSHTPRSSMMPISASSPNFSHYSNNYKATISSHIPAPSSASVSSPPRQHHIPPPSRLSLPPRSPVNRSPPMPRRSAPPALQFVLAEDMGLLDGSC